MTLRQQSLFNGIPATLLEESFQTLAEKGNTRVERIVSAGQTTPPGEWYKQEWDEWVLLISGAATLLFEDENAPLSLTPGDHVMIPANRLHRVEWTDPARKTIWLAVHFG